MQIIQPRATSLLGVHPPPNAGMRWSTPRIRAITSQARRFLTSRDFGGPGIGTSLDLKASDSTYPYVESLPFRFESGISLFAKRPPRAFPPPFLSPPSGSFSEPLSTHDKSRDRRALVNGELIHGHTNGDDAVYTSDTFVGVSDGVGAWSTRPGGHAG